jgi:16S rRNA (guanine966-N2)-methyltransferase
VRVHTVSVRITGGEHRGRRLGAPTVRGLRPTTEVARSAVFSILGQGALGGTRVLDAYAGTGMLGIESLSRGAAWVDFVESDRRLAQRIRENLRSLNMSDRAQVHGFRVERAIDRLPGGYDLVFADPPYRMRNWIDLLSRLAEATVINEGGILVAEHRYTTDLEEAYGRLTVMTRRRFGQTSLTFYQAGAVDG